ncbi:MAG: hypothetical protein ACW991_04465, partial [Candidatus Hodarchaeales archaeon]
MLLLKKSLVLLGMLFLGMMFARVNPSISLTENVSNPKYEIEYTTQQIWEGPLPTNVLSVQDHLIWTNESQEIILYKNRSQIHT